MSSNRIGIIAEDSSDVETMRVLIEKICHENISVRHAIGNGCGKIKKKCRAWADNLKTRGCNLLILLHDLDEKNLDELSQALEDALSPCPIRKYFVSIPVEEIEAWLLSDAKSLKKSFNLKKIPKVPANPERINSPKEYLENLIRKSSANSKVYLNTRHNAIIARNISINQISSKCQSFERLRRFLNNNLN